MGHAVRRECGRSGGPENKLCVPARPSVELQSTLEVLCICLCVCAFVRICIIGGVVKLHRGRCGWGRGCSFVGQRV